jgi:hypothetical protein
LRQSFANGSGSCFLRAECNPGVGFFLWLSRVVGGRLLVRSSLSVSYYSDTERLARDSIATHLEVLVAADPARRALSILSVESRADIRRVSISIDLMAVDSSPRGPGSP